MRFYSEEATSAVILLLGIVAIAVSGFEPLLTVFVLLTSLISFFYLIYYRRVWVEEPEDTMIGFIPGHYLLLLAFTLKNGANFFIFPMWSLLIIGTLGYDFVTNYDSWGSALKLTTMVLYCIIWCIIIFLFQRLIITSLELENIAALGTRTGLALGGLIWIGIGIFRINSSYIERRF